MNILYGLPSAIEVDGISYEILTSYRAVLEWFLINDDERLTESERAQATVHLFCMETPSNWQEAYRQIASFLCLGEEHSEELGEKVTDFRQDFKYIWSGFRRVYGIDLLKEDVHWWEFKLLLDELPDDCRYKQVVAIRSKPVGFENERAAFALMELKEKYALKG